MWAACTTMLPGCWTSAPPSETFLDGISLLVQVELKLADNAAFVRGDDEGSLHDDATWLLDFYDTFKDFVGSDVLDLALSSLANVEGRFGEPFHSSGTLGSRMTPHIGPHTPGQSRRPLYERAMSNDCLVMILYNGVMVERGMFGIENAL